MALDALWRQTRQTAGGGRLEVDIRKFFDPREQGHLRAFLPRRVRDGVLLRMSGKWRKAGVLAEGGLAHPEAGSPQGGVSSPRLANSDRH